MRCFGVVMMLATAAYTQVPDDATLAGMDAEIRGDWTRAVEAYRRALEAEGADPKTASRLRYAVKRAEAFWGEELGRLTSGKRWAELAPATAVASRVNPKFHKVSRARNLLERKGIRIPDIPPETEGAVAPWLRRSPGGRMRCWGTQGAPFGEAEDIVDGALRFLVFAQEEDGSWDSDKWGGGEFFDCGVTGLALLALCARGPRGLEGDTGAAAARAAAWLAKQQHGDGVFGTRRSHSFIYCTTFATWGLAEYAVVTGRVGEWRARLEKARDFLEEAQTRGAGWRYEPHGGESDTSVTARVASTLRALGHAGIEVSPACLVGAAAWVDSMTDANYGSIGYNYPGGASARGEGKQDLFPPEKTEAMTAAGCVCLLACGRDPALMSASLGLVRRMPPMSSPADMYYWEAGASALQGTYGSIDREWYAALVAAAGSQRREDGSVAAGGAWGSDGGRIYSTAICCLALAAPYREAPPRAGTGISPSAFLRARTRTIGVPGPAGAVPTGIYVDAGQKLVVGASGTIRPFPKGPHLGADGVRKTPPGGKKRIGKAPFGALLGRIGPEGKLFRIRTGTTTLRGYGHLYLLVNDAIPEDNQKGWKITLALPD